MVISILNRHDRPIHFSFSELTGALGDSVTVLPVVVAVAALTDLSLTCLLLGFGFFQIVWGLHYRLPISVEPMKALAALVIAGTLTAGELAVAGLIAGGILLIVGFTGTLGRVEQYVGQPVIRGIQVAVALILLETGIQLSLGQIWYALAALGIAGVVIFGGYRRASTLAVLSAGIVVAIVEVGVPTPRVPTVVFTMPSFKTVSSGSISAMVAQLAMTVGNAAVATSLLLSDYYDADVSADDLATSMGVMNVLAIPFGAMPMCHGSGGVAGKYAFGARTAGSNLILGGIYAGTALLAVGIVAAFPLAMLGVILVLIAFELGQAGLETRNIPLTVGIGVVGVVTNVGVAFIIGILGYHILERRGNE
ncbi:sulfate transporter [halophilic archaeon]|nr:sulfate transporter [halophilic archaeon]